jgi:isoleucyl-tRNA synthetase
MYARQNPADNMLFGYQVADEVRRRFHLKIWNVYNFFVTYANLDGWKPGEPGKNPKAGGSLDKWILIRLNQTVESVTENLEKFDAFLASFEVEKFVDDLSLWYIRRSRDRVGPAADSEKDRQAFYSTTYYVLVTLSKLFAPFMPFIAENMYTNLTSEESVHLADWPQGKILSIKDKEILAQMQITRGVVEQVHAKRKELGIPVRQPLAEVKIYGDGKVSDKEIIKLGMEELNIKKILFISGKEKIELDVNITPELKEEAQIREAVRKIQGERKILGLNLTQKVNVTLDVLPTNTKLVQWMKKKAQIENLKQGNFKVIKVSGS